MTPCVSAHSASRTEVCFHQVEIVLGKERLIKPIKTNTGLFLNREEGLKAVGGPFVIVH